MPKPPIKTNFQQDMKSQKEIADAKARGRAAIAKAAGDVKSDDAFRSANKLEHRHAGRDRARAQVNGPLQDRTGWEAIEIGTSSAK